MVAHRSIIKERLNIPFSDPNSLIITPLIKTAKKTLDDLLDDDSIDLRLGTHFLVSRSDRLVVNKPGYSGHSYQRSIHIPIGRYFLLPGHQTVLASVLEFIKLPMDFSAMVLTKSSWARSFITIETAPWVHPGYRGCLTLEIANASETPVLLYPGYQIAQLVFFQNSSLPGTPTETGLKGSYIGPVKPEPGALKKPEVVLSQQLGIPKERISDPFKNFFASSEEKLKKQVEELKNRVKELEKKDGDKKT